MQKRAKLSASETGVTASNMVRIDKAELKSYAEQMKKVANRMHKTDHIQMGSEF